MKQAAQLARAAAADNVVAAITLRHSRATARETWLSREEVMAVKGWQSKEALQRWRDREKPIKRRAGTYGNGEPIWVFALASLSTQEQKEFQLQRARAATPSGALVPAQAAEQRERCRGIHLTFKQQGEVDEKTDLISVMVEWSEGRAPELVLANGQPPTSLEQIAAWIAERNGKYSASAIYKFYCRFKKGELLSLARKARRDKGQSRFFAEHPLAAEFLRNKYLNEALSIQMSWEALCRDWSKVEPGAQCEPPSYGAARRLLGAVPKPQRVLAREGKEAHSRKCSPFVQRAPVPAMEWWVSDHRQFDVMVRNTLFAELKPDEPYRVWFTAIMDWGSRKIVGWCFAPTPSSRTISSALRLAVLNHGFPKNFYWDNGEDYKKVRRDLEAITLSDEAGAVLRRGGVAFGITTALPYHPRSKPIEPHFTHWSKRFDVIWQEAYLGNKPTNRPEKARHAEALHQKYLKGQRADSPLPTDAEFILGAMRAIEEFNNKPHRALQQRTPNMVMNEQWPESNRQAPDPRLLDLLFCERATRIVQPGGCVQLDNMRYEPTERSLFALDLRQGQAVTVLRDPYNLGAAVAADPATMRFIGELTIQELVAQCPGGRVTRDQIKRNMRRQRSLQKGYVEYQAALAAMASSLGWKTEREELMARAIESTGTDGAAGIAPAAIPGARAARQLPARASRKLQPAFVSDAVAQDAEIFKEIALED